MKLMIWMPGPCWAKECVNLHLFEAFTSPHRFERRKPKRTRFKIFHDRSLQCIRQITYMQKFKISIYQSRSEPMPYRFRISVCGRYDACPLTRSTIRTRWTHLRRAIELATSHLRARIFSCTPYSGSEAYSGADARG